MKNISILLMMLVVIFVHSESIAQIKKVSSEQYQLRRTVSAECEDEKAFQMRVSESNRGNWLIIGCEQNSIIVKQGSVSNMKKLIEDYISGAIATDDKNGRKFSERQRFGGYVFEVFVNSNKNEEVLVFRLNFNDKKRDSIIRRPEAIKLFDAMNE